MTENNRNIGIVTLYLSAGMVALAATFACCHSDGKDFVAWMFGAGTALAFFAACLIYCTYRNDGRITHVSVWHCLFMALVSHSAFCLSVYLLFVYC